MIDFLASIIVVILIVFFGIIFVLRKPSRGYMGPASISKIYDTWTDDQKMKYYWGTHLHAGYYSERVQRKDFIRAKIDMIDNMVHWGIAQSDPDLYERLENPGLNAPQIKFLDVGCGLGGTAHHLAQRWPKSTQITGITISSAQARFATNLAQSQGQNNLDFLDCDAMHQAFAAQSFDVIWSLESEVHMPDKERFFREIMRLLKPGGWFVMATWNLRDTSSSHLTSGEGKHIQYLLDEWCHTKFDEVQESLQQLKQNGLYEVVSEDWTGATLPSWREAVLVALRDTGGLAWTDNIWWKNTRDAYTILRFDAAFRKGLLKYGLYRGQKPN
jgi:MPBQ/MSBQ methyltransferase